MSRLPGGLAGQARKADPDVYTALLLVGVVLLLTACVCVYTDLASNYGLTIGQLFSTVKVPG